MTSVRVLSVASEIYPIVKTGGLADVAGALPIALQAEGVEARTLVPGYPAVIEALAMAENVLRLPQFFGGDARLLGGKCGDLELFVLDAPHLFARPGNPYLGPDGTDWPDNGLRFAGLARMAADIGLGAVPSFVPDVVHAHDWQAGLAPAYLNYADGPRPATVMTIHNLAYPGIFPGELLGAVGLPPESFTLRGVEYYGSISYMKAGLQFADRITTVSPTYAIEIQEEEQGMGFGGLLRERSADLTGILNGIDTSVWDPATDPNIASRFSLDGLQNRAANKAALQARLGLDVLPDAFLLGVISRLSWQKGLDLLLESLPTILNGGMQLALLGDGDPDLRDHYHAAAEANPGRVGIFIGYDEGLAHLIQAGADALVVPSRFEPCGLTQLCALRYGAIPIVSRVGGLADTVVDEDEATIAGGATGFSFEPVTSENLAAALRRASASFNASFYDTSAWRRMQRNGMSTDVSWRNRASKYADLYRGVVEMRHQAGPRSSLIS
jgi:starch synthase